MSKPGDDLRQRVDELEATIRGLTQELVEANERIRQLEEESDARPKTIVADDGEKDDVIGESSQPMDPDVENEPESATETDSSPEDRTEDEDTDDIIVA